MKNKKRIDLKKVVQKSRINKTDKNPVSDLEVHAVEPVIKVDDKGNKTRGEIRDGKKTTGPAAPKKDTRKTDSRTVKKGEEKSDTGEKRGVAICDRTRRISLGEILDRILPPWY